MIGGEVESQIGRWRGYVERRAGIAPDDVAEMEDHLREQIAELMTVGLSDTEAFMVAIARLGSVDEISREFAREHADRLWKQLAWGSDRSGTAGSALGRPSSELVVVLTLAVCSAIATKVGLVLLGDTRFAVTAGLFVAPFVIGYFGWKRRLAARQIAVVAGLIGLLAAVLGSYPFVDAGDTAVLAVIHAPIVMWCCVGIAYAGDSWRADPRRMDFIRFTGEFIVYYVLLALGGGGLIGLTVGSFAAVGVDASGFIAQWVLPFTVPGAVLVAAWLVEAKQSVVENIAPVLTRVFIPLTIVMLLALLGAYAAGRGAADPERVLLIMMDLVLVLVLGLVLYTISAREPGGPVGIFDWLQLILVVAALIADALMFVTMLGRIAQFGWSPNKVAALGINLVLLVNLAGTAWLGLQLVRRRCRPGALEVWQTRYLPVFGAWSLIVVVALPPIFGYV